MKEDNSIIALSHYADGPRETISTAQAGIIPGTIETFRNGTHFSIGFQRELSVTKVRFPNYLTFWSPVIDNLFCKSFIE